MTSSANATSNVDSLLVQIKRNLGLPVNSNRNNLDSNVVIDAAPFVAPYVKGERISRMTDWTASSDLRSGTGHSSSHPRTRGSISGLPGFESELDWTLSLAEPAKVPVSGRRALGPRPARNVLPPRNGPAPVRNQTRPAITKGIHATGAKSLGWGQRAYDRQKTRDTSVRIDPSWRILEEVEFSRISKLQYDPEAPEVLASGGSVPFYNKTFDRLTTKSSKPIYVDDKSALAYLPLSKDPMVKKLASEIEGTVAFMSDAAAALLMATLRTVHPWDLVARHISPNAIIIDQREDLQASSFSIDQVLVSETANEPPTEDREAFNSAFNLALEASRIGNIMPSVICSNDLTLNLGSDLSAPSHCAYKYFKWTMGDGNFLVIRSLINAANRMGTTEEPVLIRSLLEFDSSRYGNNLDWRSKLDNQRGAILANEIKNNNSMIARWVFQAHLAQIDSIKLAYVSRVSPKDRVRHELLALQDIEPYELATQMNLDTVNGFGILKALFDIIIQSQDSIAIIRDPVKPILRLYNL